MDILTQKLKEALPELKEECWRSQSNSYVRYMDYDLEMCIRVQNENMITCTYIDIDKYTITPDILTCDEIKDLLEWNLIRIGKILPDMQIQIFRDKLNYALQKSTHAIEYINSTEFNYDKICKQVFDKADHILNDDHFDITLSDIIDILEGMHPISEEMWKYIYDNYFHRLEDSLQTKLKMKFKPQEVSFKDYMSSIGDDE